MAEAEAHAPARVSGDWLDDLAAAERFKVEFTGTEEYVRLVQEAKALLSHRALRVTFEKLQLRAMRAFVEGLRKQKYGSKDPAPAAKDEVAPRRTKPTRLATSVVSELDGSRTPSSPRQRGRHIPAAVRRAVAARDAHRCTYTDACGRRCSETRLLEFHHVVPFAVCHSHEARNLTLRFQAHNALAAEEDFGRNVIEARKSAARHDSFSKQGP